jgi:hypothetical protein
VGFTSVGAIILARRPDNPIARLCVGIGLVLGVHLTIMAVVGIADVRPGRLPGWMLVLAQVSDPLRFLGLAGIAALLVRFPSGRLPSRRWRVVDVLLLIGWAMIATGFLRPGELNIPWILIADNPIGVDAIPPEVFDTLPWSGFLVLVAALGVSMVGLLVTYRRSVPIERAQIRWILAAVAAAVVGIAALTVAGFEGPLSGPGTLLVFVSPLLVPIGIGVAILRYRLYDIDRIVSRTIGYAAVTGVLGVVFVGTNLVLQAILAPLVRADTIVVAGSTLLVAALFSPVRARIQQTVDRRFHRARHDADRLAARLADGLRDEVDLAALRARTVEAVDAAVEPVRTALWLRERQTP